MGSIKGFVDVVKIYETPIAHIFRAKREDGKAPVFLKVLKVGLLKQPAQENSEPQSEGNGRSPHMSATPVSEGFVEPGHDSTIVLDVLNDTGGDFLRGLTESTRLPLTEILTLGIRLSEILGEIHAAHMIHGD